MKYSFSKDRYKKYNKLFWFMFAAGCLFALLPDGAFAEIQNAAEKSLVEGLQKDVFGNTWMVVAKIVACLVGLIMSLRSMSLVPFATSMGVTAGIHFFQKYTSSAAGMLIP
jgi:hypothetical protein